MKSQLCFPIPSVVEAIVLRVSVMLLLFMSALGSGKQLRYQLFSIVQLFYSQLTQCLFHVLYRQRQILQMEMDREIEIYCRYNAVLIVRHAKKPEPLPFFLLI